MIDWIVMKEGICVSSKAINLMKDLSYGGPGDRTIDFNCRPIQKTGDRSIKLYMEPKVDAMAVEEPLDNKKEEKSS